MKNGIRFGVLRFVALVMVWAVMQTVGPRTAYAAGPWYVSNSGNDTNACTSAATACASINGALNKPGFVAGDMVKVAMGTYTGTGTEVVLLNKSATLSGGWDPSFTTQNGMSTIDGQAARRGITINNGAIAIVEHFTVQNGSAISGGGIYNVSNLTLNTSIVISNATTNNTYGGGIFNAGNLAVNISTVRNNIGDYQGGGIYNTGNLILTNSAIISNSISYYTGEGGGINNNGGTLALSNVTISGNKALGGRGGGISNWSNATVYNVTITNNQSGEGGGINNIYGLDLVLRNSIVAGNIAVNGPDCYDNSDFAGSILSQGNNLIGSTVICNFTPNTGDLTNIHPRLRQLQNNGGSTPTHALLGDSPAINAGNPAGCTDNLGNPLATDQRGAPRVGRCDIGAYEYGSAPPSSAPPPGTNLIFLPLIQTSGSGCKTGICGRVTYNSVAASGVSLDLRFYNGSSWSTFATRTTDSGGNYSFTNVPSLSGGQFYYVRYLNGVDNTRLSSWATRSLLSYSFGGNVEIGNFDIADCPPVSPLSGATVSLPPTFQWTRRSTTPSDGYEFNMFHPVDFNPYWWTDPLLGYVDNYTLPLLPSGFNMFTPYGWFVAVYSPDDGYGESFYYYTVTFSGYSSSPTVRAPAQPALKKIDLPTPKRSR